MKMPFAFVLSMLAGLSSMGCNSGLDVDAWAGRQYRSPDHWQPPGVAVDLSREQTMEMYEEDGKLMMVVRLGHVPSEPVFEAWDGISAEFGPPAFASTFVPAVDHGEQPVTIEGEAGAYQFDIDLSPPMERDTFDPNGSLEFQMSRRWCTQASNYESCRDDTGIWPGVFIPVSAAQ